MTSTKVPDQLADRMNPVKNRILFLSPSVVAGEEREARKEDFESLNNSNIGAGGFGKVYKVKHRVSHNIYAIKVINKAKILESELVEQMKLEVRIMYKLHHPNIIKLYNHFEDDENFYLVLELAAKGQLYTKLRKLGHLEERVAAQFIREIASAIGYLHGLNPPIIHRDIKPENILLDDNETGKLCDFGWSNFNNKDRKRMTYCGTPEYLAPEMIKQVGHDESLDLWGIGVLTFELLTGKAPFDGSAQTELYDNILKLKINYPKDFPKLARDLVSRLLKVDPKERINIHELQEHAWFKFNVPIRTVSKKMSTISASPDGEMRYEPVSKKSIVNFQKPRPPGKADLLKEALRMVKKKDEKDKVIEDISNKYQTTTKELSEMKIKYQMKLHELEAAQKENAEAKARLESSQKGFIPESTLELRKLTDEVQKLKTLNKTRKEVITEIDKRNALISEQDTKIKLMQNEIAIEKNATEMLDEKVAEGQERVATMEKKYESLRLAHEELQKQKELKEAELETKLETMQKKISSKVIQTEDSDTETMAEVIQTVLDEIKGKIKMHIQGSKEEGEVVQELLATYRKFADLKTRHDNEVVDVVTSYAKRAEEIKEKAREEQLAIVKRREESVAATSRQLQEIEEKGTAREGEADRQSNLKNIVELQKRLVTDLTTAGEMQGKEMDELREQIQVLKERLGDLEYQYGAAKNKHSKMQRQQAQPARPAVRSNIYI